MAAYTNIDDPSAYFTTTLYAGNGNADHAITNDANAGNFQPDMLWYKSRSYASSHILYDSSRGDTHFFTVNTAARSKEGGTTMLDSFDSNGFTLGSDTDGNRASNTFVAWQWKANGGTTSTNTTGSVDSVVQVNTDAGISVVTFDSASSGNFSVGHGLGVQPAMIITKNREGTSNWWTWHKSLTGGNSNTSYVVALERTNAEASYANAWGAGVTSSVFGMQSGNTAVASKDYVAYCFSEVQGYSKFSKYIGNGNADGTFVYTGFQPAFVLLKPSSAADNWIIVDNKRDSSNAAEKRLFPDTSGTEGTGYDVCDMLSNGFKMGNSSTSWNGSGRTYIYMAFAEHPFTTSTGIPTTAR